MRIAIPALAIVALNCSDAPVFPKSLYPAIQLPKLVATPVRYEAHTWPYFLQHLPARPGPIVNYKGQLVSDQDKHAYVLEYDVGTRDLQQCADALIRLRAEYLYSQNRWQEIGFHFTDGSYYSFKQ